MRGNSILRRNRFSFFSHSAKDKCVKIWDWYIVLLTSSVVLELSETDFHLLNEICRVSQSQIRYTVYVCMCRCLRLTIWHSWSLYMHYMLSLTNLPPFSFHSIAGTTSSASCKVRSPVSCSYHKTEESKGGILSLNYCIFFNNFIYSKH